MNNKLPKWHVVYTMPKQEKQLISKLTEIKVNAFLPLIKTVNQWHDRKKTIEAPLFPSYVFVYIENRMDMYKISALKGVVSFVKFGNELATLSQSIIDNIKLTITNFSHIEITAFHFQPGQQLIIKDGPLSGFECELITYNGNEKALVRMDILNRNLLIDIDLKSMSKKR